MLFLARNLIDAARKVNLTWCKEAVASCSDVALRMNSSSEDAKQLLSQLLFDLAYKTEAVR